MEVIHNLDFTNYFCPSKQATFLGTLALYLHFHGNFTAINSEYVTVWANFKLSILNQSLGYLILFLTWKEIRTQQIKEILHGLKLMFPISRTLIICISKIGCCQGILLVLINQEREPCDVVMKVNLLPLCKFAYLRIILWSPCVTSNWSKSCVVSKV